MSDLADVSTSTAEPSLLRLAALDDDDLAILSANMQDALVVVADLAYLPRTQRFVLACRRFDWVKSMSGGCERRACGLHFERVQAVAFTGFAQADTARELNLLAIHFVATDAPAGRVELTFSGGAAIRLEVECLEAQMRDLGPCWPCGKQPVHPLGEDGSSEECGSSEGRDRTAFDERRTGRATAGDA